MKRALLVFALLLARPAFAHVGSPDIFFEGEAGRYHAVVTIRPPDVIPGLAEISVRVTGAVSSMHILALPLNADNSAFAPTPDTAERSPADPEFFTGHLWLMSTGSWQVRLLLDGDRGHGELAIPVPALPTRVQGMQTGLGVLLLALLLFLTVGGVSIVAAAAREAELPAGAVPAATDQKRARKIAIITGLVLVAAIYFGDRWWAASERAYGASVYKPEPLDAKVSGDKLLLNFAASAGDLLPDHGHLMHLFVVAMPDMDRVWHLHPDETAVGHFEHALPTLPAGRYALFADIVHKDGLPETLTSLLTLPASEGAALTGDDSAARAVPLSHADAQRNEALLPDGAKMIWQRPASIEATRPIAFHFSVIDKDAKPAHDLEPYMGMLAHAAILRDDASVFVHLHPSGSVPMASLMLAQGMPAGHQMQAEPTSSEITFPYGFPSAGRYRLFVQIRRGGQVQTASFDADVH